ncbi:hypothetical protein [Mycobacterium intracellulare]
MVSAGKAEEFDDPVVATGRVAAVDGGYTAGRDHGVVELFGFPS